VNDELEGCGRKWSWPTFNELSQHLPRGTEDAMKNLSQDSQFQGLGLNPGPPEYENNIAVNIYVSKVKYDYPNKLNPFTQLHWKLF
jgi:hypothetical protein